MSLYSLYSASFVDTGGLGTLHMNQLEGQDVQPSVRIEEYVVPGTVDRAVNLVMDGDPVIPFRSHDLAWLLGNIDLTTGAKIGTSATFRYQKRVTMPAAAAGTFVSGSNHVTVSSNGGLLVPTGISVAHGGLAVASLTYVATWNGDRSVLPLVAAFSQGLSTGPEFNSAYTLGPVRISGADIPGLIGWEFQTGLQIVPRKKEGHTFPTTVFLQTRKPRIVLRFDTPDPISLIGNMFHAPLGGTIQCWLRRKSQDTGHGCVADTTASHAFLEFEYGTWMPEMVSAAGVENAALSVPVLPTSVVTVDDEAAISS